MYVHQREQLIKICKSMDSYCIVVDFWSESYTGNTLMFNINIFAFFEKVYHIVVYHLVMLIQNTN